jgi:hypothetical protein
MRAVTKAAPPPVLDTRADQTAVQQLVRAFNASFSRRDTSALRLLPADARQTWRLLFLERGVTDFSATLGTLAQPSVSGDSASVQFAMTIAFRSNNQNVRNELRYVGTAQRSPTGWRLVSLTTQR